MTLAEGKYIAREKVTGNEQGITEVRSTSELLEDGSMLVSSEYLQNGEWREGHKIRYTLAPDEKVLFK